LKRQLTAYFRWQHLMNTEVFSHDAHHLSGESAIHPIESRCGVLAALLRLAGMSPPRCLALPAHRITAHSGASNCRFKVQSFTSHNTHQAANNNSFTRFT
jgi:hypothetical protein